MNNSPLLLIVDDEKTILQTLKEVLEDEQYRVEILDEGQKTLDVIGKLIPDLVLLDIFMPNCNGLELLEKIKKEYPQQKVMIISGFGNIQIAIEAVKKGAIDFIEKPLNLDEILTKIKFLKDEFNLNSEKKPKEIIKQNLEKYGIIGQSYLFLELIQQINQVAKLKLPLLIYGQHGTGKSLLAKYVHQISFSKEEDFHLINCSSLEEEGTLKKIEDVFINKTGSLFIKHVDKLSFNGQKKLLSYLELYKNIRVITSSCSSLYNKLKEEKFNSSLFHKLNATPLEIPPLNKRRYDIPLLVDYFLRINNAKLNKNIVLDNKSIRFLRNHNWQVNVTELKIVIEKLVQITDKNEQIINSETLSSYLEEKRSQVIEEQSFLRFNSLKEATNEFEKNFLMYLLKKNRYDIKQVSDRLDLTPIQLRDKILKLNLEVKL